MDKLYTTNNQEQCKTGWQSANGDNVIPGGGGHKCYDVDECKTNKNLHHSHNFCAQQCENTEGSYTCGCDIGFINKDGQGRVCVDIGTEINTKGSCMCCIQIFHVLSFTEIISV